MKKFVSLMYHNVTEDEAPFKHLSPSITSYFVDKPTFAKQLQAIDDCSCCVAFEESAGLLDLKPPHEMGGRPAVHITFDDGWQGTWDVAGPLLESHKFQATVFVTTGLIDQPLFLSRGDLHNLPQEQFHIGSHGATHRMLNQLPHYEIEEELRSSKQELEAILGYEISSVSIPGGAADERVMKIAEEVGYRYLFTSEVHLNSERTGPMRIGRVPIRKTTTNRAFNRYLAHNLQREHARRLVLECPKRLLGNRGYASLRRVLLGEAKSQHEMSDLLP